MLMDEQGIDRAMMWPTLASLLEERLADDPVATHVVVHAFNQWMHEQWTFNFDDRIVPTPVITLPIVDRAIEELEWVLERGAKAILIRPAPVPDFGPRRRSFALEEFDRFWKIVEDADIVVGMHASDDGYQRYINEWEGQTGEFLPFSQKMSGFYALMHAENRVISDVVSSIVGHGLATRFPKLRIMPVENGSAWVRPLVDKFQKVYDRSPKAFDEDPLVAFKRCVYIHPFHEEDPIGLVNLIGVDNVLFGSDYPHAEGMYDPVSFVDQLEGLSDEDKAKVMGGNLARVMRVAA
jgi:predicted TIM-barrel fold metal-dependent hydrolase